MKRGSKRVFEPVFRFCYAASGAENYDPVVMHWNPTFLKQRRSDSPLRPSLTYQCSAVPKRWADNIFASVRFPNTTLRFALFWSIRTVEKERNLTVCPPELFQKQQKNLRFGGSRTQAKMLSDRHSATTPPILVSRERLC